jgi:hypothetical protein
MAHLQRDVVNYGTGQMSPDASFIARANTTADKWLCQNLIVRGTPYQSYSILALALLFAAGVLIMLLSLAVEDVVAFMQRRWHRGAVGRHMWKANETLQVQRMLYEHGGASTWWDAPNGVPVTRGGHEMAMLTVGDLSHPNRQADTELALGAKHPPPRPRTALSLWWSETVSGRWKGVRHSGAGYSPRESCEGRQRQI